MTGSGIRRNKFTAEQVEILRGNPYVRNVNEDTVSFTVEFKEEFWRLYAEEDMAAYILEVSIAFMLYSGKHAP